MDKPVVGFTDEALAALTGYDWPGNVRELRNAVERSLLSCSGNLILPGDLPDRVLRSHRAGAADNTADAEPPVGKLADLDESGLDGWLAEAERRLIVQALDQCNGVQVQAARMLGISERSLWHRLKKLDIQVNRSVR